MNNQTCEHLAAVEAAALADGIAVGYRGDWWGSGSTRNLYLNCILDGTLVRHRFHIPEFVVWHEYDGMAAGHEAGLECKQCKSLLVGGHPRYGGTLWPKHVG